MKLYHFLNAQYALDAIRQQRYKLSTYDNLNDPLELFATDMSDHALRVAFRGVKDDIAARIGMLCCSKNWNTTLLWSHYADRHRGIALEFEVAEDLANHVEYREKRVPMTAASLDADFFGDKRSGVEHAMLKVKGSDWAYEDEVRIFHDLALGKPDPNGLYFNPFTSRMKLVGVVLGPLCSTTTTELAAAVPLGLTITVKKARVAFGSFRVVENQSFKPRQITGEMPV